MSLVYKFRQLLRQMEWHNNGNCSGEMETVWVCARVKVRIDALNAGWFTNPILPHFSPTDTHGGLIVRVSCMLWRNMPNRVANSTEAVREHKLT